MPPFIDRAARYAVLGGLTAATLWTAAVYRESSKIDRKKIKTVNQIPEVFEQSLAHSIVNPRQVNHTADSRSIKIKMFPSSTVPTEQILTWMFNGFFQSWIFAPEALAFRGIYLLSGKTFTNFSSLPTQSPPPLWLSRQLSDSSLPPLHTSLFGAFQILDIWHSDTTAEHGVDVAFGSENGTSSGVHCLSVAQEANVLDLSFSCLTCNPTQGDEKPLTERFPFVMVFHRLYAQLLFRAAVGNAVRKLEGRGLDVRLES